MNSDFKKHLAGLTEYVESIGWAVNPLPKVVIKRDDSESENLFGKTAYYEPVSKTIVLYAANRHPKDVLRSYVHEMRHHHQNLSGQIIPQDAAEASDPKYAQNNKAMRNLEKDAYLYGNMAFRDYCDNAKY
tara:strand:+ start:704 stop:1096 length:393 start_codon:yes stop_codon:yes gene_type:complete